MTPSGQSHFGSMPGLRNPVVRTGLITGALLSLLMTCALLAANRVPWLEKFALERNGICYGMFWLVMLIPIARFRRSPVQLFASAIIGWVILTLAYVGAGNFFSNLYTALRPPGVVLAYGAAAYGLSAVVIWVFSLGLTARHHRPVVQGRRRTSHTHR